MEPGQFIKFDLETWPEGSLMMQEVKAPILSICKDPLGRHETKAIINYQGDDYGIPLSQVKEVLPADGEQLLLFTNQ